MEINNGQKEYLLNITKELKIKLPTIIESLNELYKLLDECKINSYYTRTIQERISESKIGAGKAGIRTDEFIDEIENGIILMEAC